MWQNRRGAPVFQNNMEDKDEESNNSKDGNKMVAPDGGYGWVVAVSSFMLQGISCGMALSVGIYYPEWLRVFNASHTATAWIGSVNTGLLFAGGHVASVLTNRYGHRFVCILGSMMATVGLAISSYVSNIYIMYLSYSCFAGLGFCFIYIPSVVVVGQYFEKRRSIAMPITVAGVGLFCLILPPILNTIIHYLTWRGAMLISAGFTLQSTVFSALLRPISYSTFHNFKRRKFLQHSNEHSTDAMFDLSLLKDFRFWLFFFNNMMWNMGCIIIVVLVFDYAKECGISSNKASWLVAATGLCGTLGRLVTAVLTGLCNQFSLYVGATAISGLAIGLVPVHESFEVFMCWCCLYGLCFGIQSSLLALITTNLFGVEKLTSAYGYIMVSNGIGVLIGLPIGGGLYEYTKTYEIPFYFGGSITLLSAAIMFIIPIVDRRGKSKMEVKTTEICKEISDRNHQSI